MKNISKKKSSQIVIRIAAIATSALTIAILFPANSSFAGSTVLPVEIFGKNIVSMEMPVVTEGETSPFNFILDPQGLLYETNATHYGGGMVEEGASLLFHNNSGSYSFSRYSDRLTVANRSTVPVTVTVSASVSNLDGIGLVENDDFSGNETPSIYLAIVDDEGNVQPLSKDRENSISWIMQAAPENAYVFKVNETDQIYECVLSGNPETIGFDTYSFGLLGSCNLNADWKNVSVHPIVTIQWHVDPLLPEEVLDETFSEQDFKQDEFRNILENNSEKENSFLWDKDINNECNKSSSEDISIPKGPLPSDNTINGIDNKVTDTPTDDENSDISDTSQEKIDK